MNFDPPFPQILQKLALPPGLWHAGMPAHTVITTNHIMWPYPRRTTVPISLLAFLESTIHLHRHHNSPYKNGHLAPTKTSFFIHTYGPIPSRHVEHETLRGAEQTPWADDIVQVQKTCIVMCNLLCWNQASARQSSDSQEGCSEWWAPRQVEIYGFSGAPHPSRQISRVENFDGQSQ